MKELNREDLLDILNGATILGTGGGGELSEGISLIDDALSKGKSFTLVSMDEAPQDALICTPYMLGAISALPEDEEAKYARLPRTVEPSILAAYQRFQTYLGREFYGTVACELGGSNTAVSFYAAAMNGHVIMDADPAGRAVPEITHSTYFINGLPAAPVVLANEFGETMILENLMDDERAEHVVRALAIASRNEIAAIDHALPVSEMLSAVIPGTISMAWRMGKLWRAAKDEGRDVAQAVAEAGEGLVTFRGTVTASSWQTEQGFTMGEIEVAGAAEFAEQNYRIWLKNENLIAWKNGEVTTTIPDLICLIDTDTGDPVTNPHSYVGQNVAIIVLPAPEAFTTPAGLAAFGPAYVGLDKAFVPTVPKAG